MELMMGDEKSMAQGKKAVGAVLGLILSGGTTVFATEDVTLRSSAAAMEANNLYREAGYAAAVTVVILLVLYILVFHPKFKRYAD